MDRPQIIVNFDADSAGQAATMRSIEMLLAEGFKINILQMPSGKDPDEFVRTNGAKAFIELFKTTQPYIEYVIDKALNDIDTTRPAGKVEAVNSIMPHLARMPDKVARADYAEQVANRLKVDSRTIREEMKRVAINRQQALDPKKVRAAQEVTQAERQLLELILANADVRRAMVANLTEADYAELATGAIFKAIIGLEQRAIEPGFTALSEHLEEESEREYIATLLMSDLSWTGGDDLDTLFKKATEALSSLRRKKFERRLDAIQIELGQAERENDTEKVLQLYLEKRELQQRKMALALL
jgi:DNA primase